MEFWFTAIQQDMNVIPDFMAYYEKQYQESRKELSMTGRLEITSSRLPATLEMRFAELQDIEAVLQHLNDILRRKRGQLFIKYFENVKSARALTARDCERYVDADEEINGYTDITNQVAFLRNKYLGIMKALDNKSFQLNNITKLRAAGLEDAEI